MKSLIESGKAAAFYAALGSLAVVFLAGAGDSWMTMNKEVSGVVDEMGECQKDLDELRDVMSYLQGEVVKLETTQMFLGIATGGRTD